MADRLMLTREQVEMWADASDKIIRMIAQSHLEAIDERDEARAAAEQTSDTLDEVLVLSKQAAKLGLSLIAEKAELQERLDDIRKYVTEYSWAEPQDHLDHIAALTTGDV